MSFLPEEERLRRNEEFMKGFPAPPKKPEPKKAPPPPAPPPPPPSKLSSNARRLLNIAMLKPECLSVLYESLEKVSPDERSKACKELEGCDMVKRQKVNSPRGPSYIYLEVLPDGLAEMKKSDIELYPVILPKGSTFQHRHVYPRWLKKWATKNKFRHEFEYLVSDGEHRKFLDMAFWGSDGSLCGMEICFTGRSKINSKQNFKALQVKGIKKVFVLCPDKKFLAGVKREMKKIDGFSDYKDKVEFQLLSVYSPYKEE